MVDASLMGPAWERIGMAAYGILLLPLAAFLLNGLWLGRRHRAAAGPVAVAFMAGTLALAIILALGYHAQVLGDPGRFPARTAVVWEHTWMDFTIGSGDQLSAKLGFYLDPISVMMVLIISFISLLVNIYSIGYMREDKASGRFFPLLSFFSFAMLGLVVSTNLAQTFFFWELVGAASYLLIGFWYTKPAAVAAGKKAFLLTRFADAFLLMGMLAVGVQAGGFDFTLLNHPATAASLDRSVGAGLLAFNLLTVCALGIYMGAWGKSALFPFHVWLPDAMEGPTPVSSLIHSATMVVAGIYLTARLYPLFAAADGVLRVVEFTGAFTAVFAAVIACTQTDLKRILAFSTLSQLGLMMTALGTGLPEDMTAYTASMFHIFTHAFFKCLLFLSAGMVIHAIHSNDIRDAGGLRKILPRTYWATLIAVVAIAGFWPFSGFFSKEEILHAALANGHYASLLAGLMTGGLTAFYMSRYFFLVFHGTRRNQEDVEAHGTSHGNGRNAREGLLMALPILILAAPSAMAGWLGRDFFRSHVVPWFAVGHSGAVALEHGAGPGGAGDLAGAWLPVMASFLALLGAAAAWYWYDKRGNGPGYPGRSAPGWYRLIADKFYIDEAYLFLAKRVGGRWIASPMAWTERIVVNGSFDFLAGFLKRLAFIQSLLHSGQVQAYIAVALLGLILLSRFGSL